MNLRKFHLMSALALGLTSLAATAQTPAEKPETPAPPHEKQAPPSRETSNPATGNTVMHVQDYRENITYTNITDWKPGRSGA